jgi:trans-2-enoyl-CoA reductase
MIAGRSKRGENEWWSVKVPGWQEQLGRSIENQVDYQLSGLSHIIEEQLQQLETERVLKLRYEELRSDIDTCIEELSPWMNQHNIRRRADAGTLSQFVI